MNLVVRENTVLKHEPSRPPSFTVIHPLVEYSGDSVSDKVVDLHVHHHHRRRRLLSLTHQTPVLHGEVAAVAVAVARNRIGSNGDGGGGGGGRRRHGGGEVREMSVRGFDWRRLVGNRGDAAEWMHV